MVLDKLGDQEDDKVIRILAHMIEIKATSRWAASQCLADGFQSGNFKRRVADGLIAAQMIRMSSTCSFREGRM